MVENAVAHLASVCFHSGPLSLGGGLGEEKEGGACDSVEASRDSVEASRDSVTAPSE
jgi:hypothetical protein